MTNRIRYQKGFLFLALLCINLVCLSQSADLIVPRPVTVKKGSGSRVNLDATTPLYAEAVFAEQAAYAAGQIRQQCGWALALAPFKEGVPAANGIYLVYDTIQINRPEMYTLESGDGRIVVRARDKQGVVYGIQSLLQLLPLEPSKTARVDPVSITDYPRFAYRGMHLDVSRHIFPLSFIKKYIDYLAFHKFNTFHWHLTDDQGWRLEIKSYPKLTEVGAWRKATLIGHFKDTPARYDSTRYGGFYTQDEVREIVKYAAVRGITVVPEIDIPGHSRAAIAAYPELSTRPDTTWEVATTWGMYNRQNNVLAPREATFTFLEKVFSEVADLFPSSYIHVGGDECSKVWWKQSPQAQQFIREKGLKDEKGLQTYFIKFVENVLKRKGKQIIGWHEILEGPVDSTAIVMNWATDKEGTQAALRRHRVIMTPGKPLYFDHYQSKDPKDSLAIHGYNPLEAVYRFDPIPAALRSGDQQRYIIGAQANVWTEYMETPSKVEYMVFPRMTALSEVLWTPEGQRDFTNFKQRLKKNILPRYALWGSSYFKDFEKWTAKR